MSSSGFGRLILPIVLGDTAALDEEARRAGEGAAGAASQGAASAAQHLSTGLKVIGTAAAAAAGLAIAGAIGQGIEKANLQGTIQAQLGVDPADAKAMANRAGALYAAGWGESITEISDNMVTLRRALAGVAGGANLDDLTKQAMALSKAFGVDVTGAANAAAQMVKTGLAPNAQAAFDVIAKGLQNGANKADDLLDTFNEYGTQFRKLGIDGPHALGLIQQGLQGGARDADIVADALKEFSLRAIDGTKGTISAYQDLGLIPEKMQAQIAKGGPAATAGLQTVLQHLKAMKNPALQAATATALFGTQSEDLGRALYSMNPATALAARGMEGLNGSAKKVATGVSSTVPTFETFKRQAIASLGGALDGVAPLLTQLTPLIPTLTKVALGFGAIYAIVKVGSVISSFASGVQAVAQATRLAAAAQAVWTGAVAAWNFVSSGALLTMIRTVATSVASRVAIIASAVASGIATAAQWLWNLAMTANPIGIIIVVIAALVAAIIWVATQTTFFQDLWNVVWGAIVASARAVGKWIQGVFTDLGNFFFVWLPGKIRGGINAAIGFLNMLLAPGKMIAAFIIGTFNNVVTFFAVTLPQRIRSGFQAAVGFIRGAINMVIGLIRGIRIPPFSVPSPFGGSLVSFGGLSPFAGLPSLADGATILPTRGGTLVRVGEAGRSESVVDTGLLNKKLAEGGGVDPASLADAVKQALMDMAWSVQIDPSGMAKIVANGNTRNGRR